MTAPSNSNISTSGLWFCEGDTFSKHCNISGFVPVHMSPKVEIDVGKSRFLWLKKVSKLPSGTWQYTYSRENNDTFRFSEATWRCSFDFDFREWLLNICLIGSNRDLDLAFSLSVTNSRYLFCSTLSDGLTVSTTDSNIMTWVSRTSRSLVDSPEGFPIFVIAVDSGFTCFLNAFCTPFICLWWRQSGFLPWSLFVTSNEHLNSLKSLLA